ncbi:MAG: hypothetical protein MZW92_47720 [Comamonadaceae bacterium]|nr:hypothetical protein [Comamonadaceae bacterium]
MGDVCDAGALIVAIVLAFGYTQHWFKAGTDKAKEVLSAVMPASAHRTERSRCADEGAPGFRERRRAGSHQWLPRGAGEEP